MDGHPFTAIPNILRSIRVACPGEVLCLVREELAFENVSNVWVMMRGKAYKEPKSIEGIAKMSSVSTPYDPSNALPGSEAFAGVDCLAYNLGQPRQ